MEAIGNRKPRLNDDEMKIVRALEKVENLWKKYGKHLVLFNGNELRKGGHGAQNTVAYFSGIRGDGGDGGDNF